MGDDCSEGSCGGVAGRALKRLMTLKLDLFIDGEVNVGVDYEAMTTATRTRFGWMDGWI